MSELAESARSGGENGGMSLPELRRKQDTLKAEQALLLDKLLKDMDSKELNAQLKTLSNLLCPMGRSGNIAESGFGVNNHT